MSCRRGSGRNARLHSPADQRLHAALAPHRAPVENLADYFQAADMFLCPSRSEGLSLAVLEALVNGLPLVHSDIPAIESARDNPALVLCKPGDSTSLAEAIQAVLGWTPEERARRTAAGVHACARKATFARGPSESSRCTKSSHYFRPVSPGTSSSAKSLTSPKSVPGKSVAKHVRHLWHLSSRWQNDRP